MFVTLFRKESEEERWLRKALIGDNAATEWIYRTYVRYLAAVCSRYITEEENIKDVLQESFIKIFSSLDNFKYRGEGSLKAWMARITLNETLRFIRNNSRFALTCIDETDMNIANSDNMETEGIPTEMLYQFIRELPEGYRTVFNLYIIDDKSHKEIASILGIKENTSASQLHKAKAMLAQKIRQYKTINSI